MQSLVAASQLGLKKGEDEIEPDIQELCDHFKMDREVASRMNTVMKRWRMNTWDDDIKKLYEVCEQCKGHPAGLVMKKLTDMANGLFVSKIKKDKDIEALAKKYKLDDMAKTKLTEAMQPREETKEEDLIMIEKHLKTARNPSMLTMSLLRYIHKEEPLPEPRSGGLERERGDRGSRDDRKKSRERSRDRSRDRRRKSRSRKRSRSRSRS